MESRTDGPGAPDFIIVGGVFLTYLLSQTIEGIATGLAIVLAGVLLNLQRKRRRSSGQDLTENGQSGSEDQGS